MRWHKLRAEEQLGETVTQERQRVREDLTKQGADPKMLSVKLLWAHILWGIILCVLGFVLFILSAFFIAWKKSVQFDIFELITW